MPWFDKMPSFDKSPWFDKPDSGQANQSPAFFDARRRISLHQDVGQANPTGGQQIAAPARFLFSMMRAKIPGTGQANRSPVFYVCRRISVGQDIGQANPFPVFAVRTTLRGLVSATNCPRHAAPRESHAFCRAT